MRCPTPRRVLRATLALLVVLAPLGAQEASPEAPRNVVLMIADGFGPASRTFARVAAGRPLTLDSILVGSASTHPADGPITDSAASATAYACGVKTYNGAIAVDTERRPVATLVEAAEARGLWTGVVTTTRLTHATPAAFVAHVVNRGMETDIADQMLGQGVEVLLGGGQRSFLPRDAGGARADGRDLVAEAEAFGYRFVATRDELADEHELPVLGLFADSHLAYEVDREPFAPEQPSLTEMTSRALALLAEAPDGFVLVVEGGRIDHAGHANDAVGHLHDILAYDEAVAAALDFAHERGDTLVLSVADHETGGLTVGRDVDGVSTYRVDVGLLNRVGASADGLAWLVASGGRDVRDVLVDVAGLAEPAEAEVEAIATAVEGGGRVELAFADVVSRRAGIGWTTLGHTAVDVEVFADGPGAERFHGHLDNAEIGRRVAGLLGFDLAALSSELR